MPGAELGEAILTMCGRPRSADSSSGCEVCTRWLRRGAERLHMTTVRFHTQLYKEHPVSIRPNGDGDWYGDLPGKYVDGAWEFDLAGGYYAQDEYAFNF